MALLSKNCIFVDIDTSFCFDLKNGIILRRVFVTGAGRDVCSLTHVLQL